MLLFLRDNIFWYLFIIFIDFLAIKLLLTSILLSYYRPVISVKWEYRIQAAVASSWNLKSYVCSFNFLLREIIYIYMFNEI